MNFWLKSGQPLLRGSSRQLRQRQIHSGFRVRILVRIMPLGYNNVFEAPQKIEEYWFLSNAAGTP